MATIELVRDEHISAISALKRKWQENDQKAGDAEVVRDAGRGRLLSEAEKTGLTQREMAEALAIGKQHVGRLLRYDRFLMYLKRELEPMGYNPVAERLFRRYWEQLGNTQGLGRGPLPKNKAAAEAKRREQLASRDEHERKAFREIAEHLRQGKPPIKRTVVKKKKKLTRHQYTEGRRWRDNLRKELQHQAELIMADAGELKRVGEPDHPMKTNITWISAHAASIEAKLEKLVRFINHLDSKEEATAD